MPAAWLGLDPRFKRPTVIICAWCADKAQAEALAAARGLSVTHGQCPTCHAVSIAEIRGQPSAAFLR